MAMNVTPELVISVVALGCSTYAILLNRKHQRLSVVPHLEWHTDRTRAKEGTTFTFTLKNTGMGPAIILDRWFSLDGKRYGTNLADPMPELAELCFRGKSAFALKRNGSPGVGSILPAGQNICIAELFVPGFQRDQDAAISKLLERVDFAARYQSLHGEVFSFGTQEGAK